MIMSRISESGSQKLSGPIERRIGNDRDMGKGQISSGHAIV